MVRRWRSDSDLRSLTRNVRVATSNPLESDGFDVHGEAHALDVVVAVISALGVVLAACIAASVRKRGKEHGDLLGVVVDVAQSVTRVEEKLDAHVADHEESKQYWKRKDDHVSEPIEGPRSGSRRRSSSDSVRSAA